jgi:hypothetical protein
MTSLLFIMAPFYKVLPIYLLFKSTYQLQYHRLKNTVRGLGIQIINLWDFFNMHPTHVVMQ